MAASQRGYCKFGSWLLHRRQLSIRARLTVCGCRRCQCSPSPFAASLPRFSVPGCWGQSSDLKLCSLVLGARREAMWEVGGGTCSICSTYAAVVKLLVDPAWIAFNHLHLDPLMCKWGRSHFCKPCFYSALEYQDVLRTLSGLYIMTHQSGEYNSVSLGKISGVKCGTRESIIQTTFLETVLISWQTNGRNRFQVQRVSRVYRRLQWEKERFIKHLFSRLPCEMSHF